MSVTTNKGTQVLTFDFKAPAKGREFNKLLHNIIKPGVYKGLTVTIDTANKINIAPGYAFLNCVFESETARGTLVRFQTTVTSEEIPQSTPGQDEVVYLLFEYKEIVENWVGIYHANVNTSLPDNAVVICNLTYDGSGNITSVSYTNKTWGLLNADSSYSLPDSLEISNVSDNSKKIKFNLSTVSTSSRRILSVPNYDYALGTIDDWTTGRTYQAKEVVLFNNALYRSNVIHVASGSFYTDLANWDSITEVSDEEKVRGYNDSGAQLSAGRVVTITGDSTTEEIPEISYISAYTNEPFGVVISNISNGSSGEVIQRGRLVVAAFDSSLGSIGQKLYCDASGNLTLTVTPIVVGQLITPAASNSVIYVGILPTEEGINPVNFNGQLSIVENTIQKAFDRLDDYGYCPNWSTSQTYRIGNTVRRTDDGSNSIWQCSTAHTSTSFASDISNWTALTDSTGVKLVDRRNLLPGSSNVSVSGGTNATLSEVTIDISRTPVFNIVDTKELRFLNPSTVTSSGVLNNVSNSETSHLRLSAATELTGLTAPTSGQKYLILTNTALTDLIVKNDSSNSSVGNRILTGTGADLTLDAGATVNLVYDTVSSYWRISGGSGGGTGSGGSDGLIYSPSVLTANLKAGEYNDWTLLLAALTDLAIPRVYFTENCTIPAGDFYNYEFVSANRQDISSFGANLITVTLSGSPVDDMIPKYLERIDYNFAAMSGAANLNNSYHSLVGSKIRTTTYTLVLTFTVNPSIDLDGSVLTSSALGTTAVLVGTAGRTISFLVKGDSSIKDGFISTFDNIQLSLMNNATDFQRTDEKVFPIIGSVTKAIGGVDPLIFYSSSYPKIRKFYEVVTTAKATFTLPIKGTTESVIVFVDGYPQFENFGVTGTSLVFTSNVDANQVVNGWVISL